MSNIFKKLLVLSILSILSLNLNAQDGEKLFKNNCSACHMLDQKMVGPALKGVKQRVMDEKDLDEAGAVNWLKAWIKNSSEVIESGDEYAVKIYEESNKAAMTPFPDLTDDELNVLITYIDEGKKAGGDGGDKIADTGTDTVTVGNGQTELSSGILKGFLLIIGIMIILIFILIFMTASVVNAIRSKENKEKVTLSSITALSLKFAGSKIGIAIIGFVLIAGGLNFAINRAINVGIHQGYAPEQPINYSHKLHAGKNKIPCEYCHSNTLKGKNATIPSANVCMNCHKMFKQDSPEIQKIYKAIENNEPIKWVRVHNLPDHVYFNHAQHVVVGKIECQRCHGPIEEMDVVYQYSPLSMGWCIDCHRTEKVKIPGHEDKTVAEMGGLDCQKCHY